MNFRKNLDDKMLWHNLSNQRMELSTYKESILDGKNKTKTLLKWIYIGIIHTLKHEGLGEELIKIQKRKLLVYQKTEQ